MLRQAQPVRDLNLYNRGSTIRIERWVKGSMAVAVAAVAVEIFISSLKDIEAELREQAHEDARFQHAVGLAAELRAELV